MSESIHNRKLLTRREAAQYLGLAPATLARWASEGAPSLRYYRLGTNGGRVVYDLRDLDAFISSGVNRAA